VTDIFYVDMQVQTGPSPAGQTAFPSYREISLHIKHERAVANELYVDHPGKKKYQVAFHILLRKPSSQPGAGHQGHWGQPQASGTTLGMGQAWAGLGHGQARLGGAHGRAGQSCGELEPGPDVVSLGQGLTGPGG